MQFMWVKMTATGPIALDVQLETSTPELRTTNCCSNNTLLRMQQLNLLSLPMATH